MIVEVDVGGRTRRVDTRGSEVLLDGQPVHIDTARLADAVSLIVSRSSGHAVAGRHGRSYDVAIAERGSGELVVHVNGLPIVVSASLAADRATEGPASRRSGASRVDAGSVAHRVVRVVAPMPGRIAKVLVKVGDTVAARQGLVVVEAMKMENELRSPRAGLVVEVRVVEGARVEAHAVLVVVE